MTPLFQQCQVMDLDVMISFSAGPRAPSFTTEALTFYVMLCQKYHSLHTYGCLSWRGKNLGHSDLDRLARTKVQN